jgi:hypothetical protein
MQTYRHEMRVGEFSNSRHGEDTGPQWKQVNGMFICWVTRLRFVLVFLDHLCSVKEFFTRLRFVLALFSLSNFFAFCLFAECSSAADDLQVNAGHVEHYGPDPNDLWDHLHAVLFTRTHRDGQLIGGETLDPIFLPTTKHLIEGPTHDEALKLLDEILADGHKLARDPVKRAVMQRDLWAVFDWATYPFGNFYSSPIEIRSGPLQERLAKAIRALALFKSELDSLPDTYALAVKSRGFPIALGPSK